jgi:S-layer protein (TIGR01567 family)
VLATIAVNTASAADNICNSTSTCNVVSAGYKCNSWSNERYPIINLSGEKDVPLLSNNNQIWKCHVDKLARLLLDSGEKYTMKTDEKLDLGQGYSIQAKQIDVNGKKVWLEFDKNGKYVDDQIISTDTGGYNWTCSLDKIQGEDNVPVLKIHVNNVYQGAIDSLVQIDGIWLIDYANARTLKIGDTIGNLKLTKIKNGVNTSNLGSLVFESSKASLTTFNVVGTHYKCDNWSNERYPLIKLCGENYVPLLNNYNPIWKCHVDKLAKLLLNSGEKYTLKASENLDLGHGYSLQVKEIDVDGKKVWLEFDKNGKYVDDQIISTDTGRQNWTCFVDKIQGENNVPVLKVYVRNVYQGAKDSLVRIDGIWLIDYANARTLKIGDKIGNLTLEKIISGVNESNSGSLVFKKA